MVLPTILTITEIIVSSKATTGNGGGYTTPALRPPLSTLSFQANTDTENTTLANNLIARGAHNTALATVKNGKSVNITAGGLITKKDDLGILVHNGSAVQTIPTPAHRNLYPPRRRIHE